MSFEEWAADKRREDRRRRMEMLRSRYLAAHLPCRGGDAQRPPAAHASEPGAVGPGDQE